MEPDTDPLVYCVRWINSNFSNQDLICISIRNYDCKLHCGLKYSGTVAQYLGPFCTKTKKISLWNDYLNWLQIAYQRFLVTVQSKARSDKIKRKHHLIPHCVSSFLSWTRFYEDKPLHKSRIKSLEKSCYRCFTDEQVSLFSKMYSCSC